jgi:hypothetical protein
VLGLPGDMWVVLLYTAPIWHCLARGGRDERAPIMKSPLRDGDGCQELRPAGGLSGEVSIIAAAAGGLIRPHHPHMEATGGRADRSARRLPERRIMTDRRLIGNRATAGPREGKGGLVINNGRRQFLRGNLNFQSHASS